MYEMTTPLIQKDVTLRQPDSETIATLYPLEKSPSFGKAPGPTGTDIDNRSLCDWSKKKSQYNSLYLTGSYKQEAVQSSMN